MVRDRIQRVESDLAQAGREIFEEAMSGTEEVVEEALEDVQRVRRRTPLVAVADVTVQPEARRRGLKEMLSSRDALRQAIIMSEILGPPKGLQ